MVLAVCIHEMYTHAQRFLKTGFLAKLSNLGTLSHMYSFTKLINLNGYPIAPRLWPSLSLHYIRYNNLYKFSCALGNTEYFMGCSSLRRAHSVSASGAGSILSSNMVLCFSSSCCWTVADLSFATSSFFRGFALHLCLLGCTLRHIWFLIIL